VPSRIAGHTCRSAVSPLSERWLRHPSTSSTTESGLPNETNAAREAERTFRFHPVAAEDVITRSTFQPRLWMHWDNCDLVQGVASLSRSPWCPPSPVDEHIELPALGVDARE
jgi:hypothetical protein